MENNSEIVALCQLCRSWRLLWPLNAFYSCIWQRERQNKSLPPACLQKSKFKTLKIQVYVGEKVQKRKLNITSANFVSEKGSEFDKKMIQLVQVTADCLKTQREL